MPAANGAAAGPVAAAPPAGKNAELGETLRLALPLVLTQLAWVAMLTTDTAMIGRLGPQSLAGATLSLMAFFLCYVVCFGITMATAALAAQSYGARQPRMIRRVVRQGLWVSAVLTLPCVIAFVFIGDMLVFLGQPAAALPFAEAYMSTLKWSLPFAVAFTVLRNFVSALNRPVVALYVMLAGVLLNALLDYALIFGHFGMPRLELVGAGVATTLVNALMFLSLLAIAVLKRPFARYGILQRFWRPDWYLFRRIFVIGGPIGGISVLEAGFFIGSVFLIGQFGVDALAANMIALQWPHIMFMVPMGLAQAATVRVGHAVGRRDAAAAYRAGWMTLRMGIAFMAVMSVVVLIVPEYFAALFIDAARADSAAVLALAVSYLFYAAFFQVGDGVQAISAGALRGLNDTATPMLIAAFSYWLVGLGSSFCFAFLLDWQGEGIWMGFVVGLTTAAVLLTWRFRQLEKAAYIPPLTPESVASDR
jgi:MATE family multidrug resistance protein